MFDFNPITGKLDKVQPSRWSRDAGNGYTYLKNSTDNVGIGTSTPSYKFTVVETNTDTSGTDYGAQINYIYTPSGTATGVKAANQVNLTTSGSSSINAEVIGNFITATHTGSQQIGNLYAQNFRVDNLSTGGIFNAWGTFADIFNSTSSSSILNATSFFARVANLSTGTITNAKPARFIVQNNTSGTITNSVCGSFEATDISGGTFTSILLNELTAMPAFTANSQTRVGLKIAAIPDPGAFTGTTEAGIWFNSDSGDARDGISWGASLDTNLYRSAANMLKTDDSFQVGGDYYSADGSQGFTGSWTNAGGDTVTVKNGIITDVS